MDWLSPRYGWCIAACDEPALVPMGLGAVSLVQRLLDLLRMANADNQFACHADIVYSHVLPWHLALALVRMI